MAIVFANALYLDNLAKVCTHYCGLFTALYAEYILLLAPSIHGLEELLIICEKEPNLLDMVINTR